jgi:hypothetical protein
MYLWTSFWDMPKNSETLKGAEMPAIRYPGVSVNIKIDSSDY